MISTVVSRDALNLSKPFGPVFWGTVLNLIGFGMTLIQAWTYCRTASKDKAIVKFSAFAMMLFDIASTCLVLAVFWTDLIVDFGSTAQFIGVPPAIGAECVLSALIAFLAQIYFITQIYNGKSLPSICIRILTYVFPVKPAGIIANVILYTIGGLAIIGLGFGLACASIMVLDPTTPHYNLHFQVVFGGAKGANAVCDIIATIMMCRYLSFAKTGIASTENLLDALTTIFMERGAAVMLIQVFTFVMFYAFQNPQYWLAPHLILSKLYVNTFFAILNSRSYLRDKHLNTHVASFSSNFLNSGNSGSTHQGDGYLGKNYAIDTATPMRFAPPINALITNEISVKSDRDSDMA
ncbi:hypothetical protein C8J56DRAFT_1076320 [Mycena floridula]|nr:hypothetical protein C8J56DRAFT_1076320 [Mycena floridula]